MTFTTLLLSAFLACNNSDTEQGSKKELSPEQKQLREDYSEIMALKNAGDNDGALKKIEAF